MALGDHIYVRRGVYTHHGIDAGDGTVIHFAGKPGFGMHDAAVTRSSLPDFLQGGALHVRSYAGAHSPEEIVMRAASRLGETGYDLFRNNCEHFATWCCTGRGASGQVRTDVTASVVTVAAVGVLAGTVWLRHASSEHP